MPLLAHQTTRFALLLATAATIMLAAASPVAASQDKGPTSRPDTQSQQDTDAKKNKNTTTDQAAADGLLAGPKVKTDDELGGPASMVRPGQQRLQQMPMTQWLRQLRQLGLSAEQWQVIKPEIDGFLAASKEYQQTHGRELRALRVEIRQARQDNKPVPELLKKATALQGLAPKPEELQEYIWEQLTPAQQDALHQQIANWREQREQAARARLQQQAADGETAMTDNAVADQSMTRGAMADDDAAPGEADRARDGRTDRQRRLQRLRDGAGDRSDLDANARKRLRFLRALQQRQRDRQ